MSVESMVIIIGSTWELYSANGSHYLDGNINLTAAKFEFVIYKNNTLNCNLRIKKSKYNPSLLNYPINGLQIKSIQIIRAGIPND